MVNTGLVRMLMAISASLLQSLIDTLGPLRASSYLASASLILVLYDWSLTLGDEVELIIPTPWTVVKVLYTIIRILTPVGLLLANYHLSGFRGQLSATFCKSWIWLVLIIHITIVASSSYLMLRRLRPLYGNSRRVTISLNLAFFVTYLIVIVMSMVTPMTLTPTHTYSPFLDLCPTTECSQSRTAGSAIFVGPMAFESIVFCLMVYKSYGVAASRLTLYASPLHKIFFRDGLIHYVSILLVRILNIFLYFAMPPEYYYLGIFLLWAIVAVSTTRLFINLRGMSRRESLDKPEVPIVELPSRNQYRGSSVEQAKIQDLAVHVETA